MLHDVCRSQTPTRTRNPLFRHRLHVSISFQHRSIAFIFPLVLFFLLSLKNLSEVEWICPFAHDFDEIFLDNLMYFFSFRILPVLRQFYP